MALMTMSYTMVADIWNTIFGDGTPDTTYGATYQKGLAWGVNGGSLAYFDFDAAANGYITNKYTLKWRNNTAASVTVTSLYIYGDSTTPAAIGDDLLSTQPVNSVVVAVGQDFRVPAGTLRLTVGDGTATSKLIFTRYFQHQFLDVLAYKNAPVRNLYGGANLYAGLLTSSTNGAGANTEVSGGSYARVVCNYSRLGVGTQPTTYNNMFGSGTNMVFSNMPTCTVQQWGLWDAASGGNLLLKGAFRSAVSVTAGESFTIPGRLLSFQHFLRR